MSLTKWMKTNSKAISKVGLYGMGAVLIGWPAIKFGTNMWKGYTLEDSATNAVRVGSGYNIADGSVDTTMTRNAVIRTGIGALAVYAARKI